MPCRTLGNVTHTWVVWHCCNDRSWRVNTGQASGAFRTVPGSLNYPSLAVHERVSSHLAVCSPLREALSVQQRSLDAGRADGQPHLWQA